MTRYPLPDDTDAHALDDAPVPGADETGGPMGPDDVQRVVHAVLSDAAQYVDQQLSPARALATDYYNGEPFGNEEEGRSQVVATEVRDSVVSVLPSALRVIFGPERVVEFVPKRPDQVEQARQMTDYCQYIFEEKQGGFLKTHAVLKDGLVRQVGIFKYWWEEDVRKTVTMEGVTLSQRVALELDPDMTVEEAVPSKDQPKPTRLQRLAHAVGIQPAPEPLFDVTVTRVDREGSVRIEAVPPEEFIFSRQARGMHDALCVAHRTMKTRGELIHLGIDPDVLEEWGQRDIRLSGNPEEVARRDGMLALDPEAGEANDKILYCEAYIPLDVDGDGVAELRKVCTIGPSYHVVDEEEADDLAFAIFCPDPEPHTMLGLSWADRTMDIQKVKSSVLRSVLDSLALSIYPRMAYEEGFVNVDDMLNTAIGAPIRMRKAGAVQPFTHPFMGKEALPVIGLFDDMVERRTGQNMAAAGLDADALQSTTKSAADAAVGASQEQRELLVRIFCEQTLKPLFRGIARLVARHQPRSTMAKLRGQWVEIDPRTWDTDLDVTVNVALGSTTTAVRQQALLAIAAKQEQILQTLGPANPLVSPAQYSTTLRRLTELLGFKDVDAFFSAVPEGWQPPPQVPQETPEQTLAKAQLQVEQMKAQKDLEIKQAELALKQSQAEADNAFQYKKLAVDETLRRYAIDAQWKATYTEQQLQAESGAQAAWLQARQQGHDQAVAAHEAAQAAQQQAHEQDMAQRAQALAEQQAAQQAQPDQSQTGDAS